MTVRLLATLLVFSVVGASGCQQESSLVAPIASAPITASSSAAAAAVSGQVAPTAWCQLSGASDSLMRCPIRLDQAGTSAAGLQLSVTWDAAALSFVGVESSVCPPGDAPCATVMAPPLKAVGSAGHSLATSPPEPSTASGAATLMIYHASNPNALLDAAVGDLVFRAKRSVAATPVRVIDAVATSVEAASLTVKPSQSTLRVSP